MRLSPDDPERRAGLRFNGRLFDSVKLKGRLDALVNENRDSESFVFGLPLPLEYFEDHFRIDLTLQKMGGKYFEMRQIDIVNLASGAALLRISVVGEACTVKIDFRYLVDTVIGEVDIANSDCDFDFSRGGLTTEELTDELDSELKAVQLLSTPFDKISKCDLKSRQQKGGSKFFLREKILKDWNGDYFSFHEQDGTYEGDSAQLEEVLLEGLCKKLLSGLEIAVYEGVNAADVLETVLFYNFFQVSDILSRIKSDNIRHLKLSPGTKLRFLYEEIFAKNIRYAISKMQDDIDDITYLPPNRFKSYQDDELQSRFGNLSADILKKLYKLREEKWYLTHVNSFIHYWCEQFGISKRSGMSHVDDLVELFEEESAFAATNLGYGLNQLQPLIFFSAIFNAKGNPIRDGGTCSQRLMSLI